MMPDRLVAAILIFLIRYYRAKRGRQEFVDAASEYKALIESLEGANATDEDKNFLLEDSVVKLLLKRDRMRDD